LVRDILFEPLVALENAARKKDWSRTLSVLAWVAVIGGLAGMVWQWRSASFLEALVYGVYFAFSLMAVGAFLAFLLELPLHVLAKGRGHFYEALTAVAFSAFPVSLGWLLAAVLGVFPLFGEMLALVPAAAAMAYGAGLLFAGLRDLFKVDAATVLLALLGLAGGLWTAVFFLALASQYVVLG
jgi:hypothetical protein